MAKIKQTADFITETELQNAKAEKQVRAEEVRTAEQAKANKKVKKSGKPNFFKRLGSKIKDVFSELKKVTWPSFPNVLKKTGIVLVVVLIFLIVITAFDFGLYQLLQLIQK